MLGQDSIYRLVLKAAAIDEMGPTKLTNSPTGLEYYRVCDEEGVCRVVKGMWKAQHLVEDTPGLTATKTRLYPAEWDELI